MTSDRYDSYSPAWSRDSKWIYFLSDRNFVSLVGSPWGSRQPEPFFDKQTRIYHVALSQGARSPFQPADELRCRPRREDDEKKADEKKDEETKADKPRRPSGEDKATDDKAQAGDKTPAGPPSTHRPRGSSAG